MSNIKGATVKKALLIIGIIALVVGIVCLAYSALMWFAYKNSLDGSAEFYAKRHSLAIVFLVVGIVIALIGAACMYFRSK